MGSRTAEEIQKEYLDLMGPQLGPVFYRLYNECVWLHWKWANYVALFGTKPERIDLLNSAAPVFFKMIQDGMWEDVLLHVCRLVDPPASRGKDNLTLQRLPRLLDGQVKTEAENALNVAKEKSKFASDWRNRRIAHKDLNIALGETSVPLASASRRSVIDALESIRAVLNAIEARYTGATVGYEHYFSNPGDAESLLYVLRDGLEARTAKRRRMISGMHLPEDLVPRSAL